MDVSLAHVMDSWTDGFALAALATLGVLGLGRAIALGAKGVSVVPIDRERRPREMLADIAFLLSGLLWIYEVVAFAWPLDLQPARGALSARDPRFDDHPPARHRCDARWAARLRTRPASPGSIVETHHRPRKGRQAGDSRDLRAHPQSHLPGPHPPRGRVLPLARTTDPCSSSPWSSLSTSGI